MPDDVQYSNCAILYYAAEVSPSTLYSNARAAIVCGACVVWYGRYGTVISVQSCTVRLTVALY